MIAHRAEREIVLTKALFFQGKTNTGRSQADINGAKEH